MTTRSYVILDSSQVPAMLDCRNQCGDSHQIAFLISLESIGVCCGQT
jgi:hypothetical protein